MPIIARLIFVDLHRHSEDVSVSLLIALLEELNERLCLLHIELIYHEVDSVQWFALALCEVQVYQRI